MDILTPEKRKENMQAIHSKDTKPEIYLRKLLFSLGYRYRSYAKNIPGHPGTSGDTELFEKPSNINGFRASEQKNILYIPPH